MTSELACCTHPQVCFWEPAKYVAALRHLRRQVAAADAACRLPPLLFITDMEAGHFACSGASGRLAERARKMAFLITAIAGGDASTRITPLAGESESAAAPAGRPPDCNTL